MTTPFPAGSAQRSSSVRSVNSLMAMTRSARSMLRG